MKRSAIKVSDHAALRYLERVCGLDLERLKVEIAEGLTAHGAQLPEGVGALQKDGFRYVIEQGVVVTVTPIGSRKPKLHRKWALDR